MSLAPGYGETPLDGDEFDALLPKVREALGDDLTKAALFDLEQAVQAEVAEELLAAVIGGDLTTEQLVTDQFVRDLHLRLYRDIWTWAGSFRRTEFSIGVAPEQIGMELRSTLDTIRYRWQMTDDWSAREVGIAAHAEVVRVHPFTDGNGRCSRLLADLVFAAAGDTEPPELYDWGVDKGQYVALLRAFDVHRDPRELARFIGTYRLRG